MILSNYTCSLCFFIPIIMKLIIIKFCSRGPRRNSGGGTIENLVEDVIVNFADYANSRGATGPV